jgi:RND family efflux transporter MFP subunit
MEAEMRRPIKYVVVAALMAVLLVTAVGCAAPEETVQRQPADLYRGDLSVSVAADGNVRLIEQREVYFETPGDITDVAVEKGDTVKQGDDIAQLDPETLDKDIKSLGFAVRLAEIDLTSAREGVTLAEVNLETSRNAYLAADSAYQRVTYPYTYRTFAFDMPAAVNAINAAMTQLEELKRTYGDAASSDDNALSIQAQIDLLLKQLAAAEEKLTLGQGDSIFGNLMDGASLLPYTSIWTLRDLQTAVDQAALTVDRSVLAVDTAKRSVSRAEVALENAQHNLTKTTDMVEKLTLKAPIDGVVTAVYAKTGEQRSSVNYLSAPVVQITDLSVLELEADVDEIDIPLVRLGQMTTLEIDAVPGIEFQGTVSYISPLSVVEAGLVLYRVKIEFSVPADAGIRAGMTATANILVDERPGVLILSDRAIKRGAGGQPEVLVELPDGSVEARTVTLGISNGMETEILSGLKEGDNVIIEIRIAPAASGLGF